LFSFIKGPGTLGIDTSGELLEVTSTIFEALDYYGIYSITRPSQCSREEMKKIHEEQRNVEEIAQENDENINSNIQNNQHHSQIKKTKSIELEDIREFAEEESSSSTTQTKIMKRKKHNDRRSSTRFIKSGNNSEGNNNNDDVLTPMEPEDVIVNRRISMGVYGMYSKFM
jgi:hypothetical protein